MSDASSNSRAAEPVQQRATLGSDQLHLPDRKLDGQSPATAAAQQRRRPPTGSTSQWKQQRPLDRVEQEELHIREGPARHRHPIAGK